MEEDIATNARTIDIEGLTPDEVLAISESELEGLAFCGEPIVFRVGSATILGEFRRGEDRLTVELAQIDGGGEGVLPTLWRLANRYAQSNQLESVEWIVHAVTCAKPNPKLRRLLERRRFKVERLPKTGEVYHLVVPTLRDT